MRTCAAWLVLGFASPLGAQSLGSPRLVPGEESVFVGAVTESSEKPSNRFRKTTDLEVRVLVLDRDGGGADCAVFTKLKPQSERSDGVKDETRAAVRVDLVRIDGRGRAWLLLPEGPPPFALNAETPRRAYAGPHWDGVPTCELGMFLPLPTKPVTLGSTWEQPEPNRPPIVYATAGEAFVHGARCLEIVGDQRTDGWDRTTDVNAGTRRTERLLVAPADGMAARVERRIEYRFRRTTTGTLDVTYEAGPPTRHMGTRKQDVRREAELAYALGRDWSASANAKATPAEFRARLAKLESFLTDRPPTSFREALDSQRRRLAAAAAGEPPPVVLASFRPAEAVLAVGKPAPDFVAPSVHALGQFRLSAVRGKPAVLAFFRPESKTSQGALEVLEALQTRYAGRLEIAGLTVHERPEIAARQRERLKLTVSVCDGDALRGTYAVDGYPRIFVVDAAGTLAARFDGFGAETGWLVHEQVQRLLAAPLPSVEVRK